MPKTTIAGGSPVTRNLLGASLLKFRPDLERKYLLDAFEKGPGDDWPGEKSMAESFAREFAKFQSAPFCALLTNGTHALQVALETLDIGFGDEVIVPGLTWQATASAVCDVNAVPILVDVEPDTMCIDPAAVERAITRRTRAIMPVHLYNRMADLERIMAIAKRHGLHVIEDCAHSHGAQWDGRGAGSWGDFGSFSFQSSKMMRSFEGGALLVSREENYWKVVSQRSCGREYRPGIRVHSGNYRLTSLQAAILRGQLAALKRNAPLIERAGKALDAAVAAAPGVRALRRSAHITRQTGYCYGFLFDPAAWDGITAETFRHALSRGYLRAISPSRWHLPVADALWKDRAVLTGWRTFGLAPARVRLLTDAIAKLFENRDELRALQDHPGLVQRRALWR